MEHLLATKEQEEERKTLSSPLQKEPGSFLPSKCLLCAGHWAGAWRHRAEKKTQVVLLLEALAQQGRCTWSE